MPNGAIVPEGVAGCRSPRDGRATGNGMVRVIKRDHGPSAYGEMDDYGGGRTNRYAQPPMRPRRPSYNPSRYYGGNSESKDELEPKNKIDTSVMPMPMPSQAGGKRRSKKSKKSRRSVEYGSMMLYGGADSQAGGKRKSKKSKKSRK
jgi:hypothetical protein